MPRVIGGRYGLSSKEFDPAMAKAVFDELAKDRPKNHFTVGIVDDVVAHLARVDHSFTTEPDDVVRAVFFGLGADGTVSANKSSVKIIGEGTDLYAQGYFVYDSKKSGSITTSHLRFGPRPIRSTYLIGRARPTSSPATSSSFLERLDVLEVAAPGATFLLNSPFGPETVWDHLPVETQQTDPREGAPVLRGRRPAGRDGERDSARASTRCCRRASSPSPASSTRRRPWRAIKAAIEKSYGKRGEPSWSRTSRRWTARSTALHEVDVPAGVAEAICTGCRRCPKRPPTSSSA